MYVFVIVSSPFYFITWLKSQDCPTIICATFSDVQLIYRLKHDYPIRILYLDT